MIWSENDVAKKFNILNIPNKELIKTGVKVFREYQRTLWDINEQENYPKNTFEEWHFH